jgi:radical SAM superfamily enzyme YgiQ (UPF0313 family)
MNVLLINPPFLNKFSREQRSPAVTKSGTFYYPMWLCFAAGLLEESGHSVRLMDCPASGDGWEEVAGLVMEFKPKLVVVDTSTPSIYNDVEVAARIKELSPDIFTVLVGPHVSALPKETLQLNAKVDAVALKEYEHTMADLAKALEEGKDPAAVPELVLQKEGRLITTPARPLVEDLDSIPFVSKAYKRHLDYKNYFYAHSKYPIVTIITGRGCPYQCVYCVYPQVFCSHKPRLRSIPNVVDEIEYILHEFPDIKEIMFEDDTLTFDKKRCLEFSEEVLRRGVKFKWSANSRCDLDLETMKALKRAGARLFCVGVESGDQGVLDRMKKSLKVERVRRFFADAKRAGIKIHGCFMVGNPGETKETLETTLRFAIELEPDTAQFFPIMVYPGTEAYDWAKREGYLTTDNFREWLTPDGLHNSIVSRPGLSNTELVEFCDRARQKFYMRPSYIAKKLGQSLTDFQEFKRLAKGGLTLGRYLFRGTYGKPRT